jgi:O-methyltransferase domain
MSEQTTAPDPAMHVFQLATGYVTSTALQLAVQVGVADHRAAGPRTAQQLAAATDTNEDALYRVLRALASVGAFDEVEPRRFALTPAADILRKDAPRSIHDVVVFIADPLHMRVYADAIESLRTGKPVFEWFAEHPEYSSTFNNAMTNMSAAIVPAVLEAYDFGDIGVLVDVAGGHGQVLRSILRTYPAMRGILMDLDHVLAGAKPYIEADGVADRCQTVAGDFFKAVPPGGDAYMMKHIIHDWDDERAAQILRSIHTAMGSKHGKVILLEGVLAPGNEPGLGKIMDLEMLLLPGGRERSAEEFRGLFDRAGFDLVRVMPTTSPLCVIEARKR